MNLIKKSKEILKELKSISFALCAILCLYFSIMLIDIVQGYSIAMIGKTFTFELRTSSMHDFFSLLVFFLLIAAYLYLTSLKKIHQADKHLDPEKF